VLTAIPLGIAMLQAPSGPVQDALFDLHRSFGAVILVLAALRIANRLAGGTPATFPIEPRWQRLLAHAVHDLLYLLLILMPILGWLGTSAFGAPIFVFWLFELPPLVAKNQALADVILPTHAFLGLTMAGLVVLHIAGALYHHLIERDRRVLLRMWNGTPIDAAAPPAGRGGR
jgi:cytochrome b561